MEKRDREKRWKKRQKKREREKREKRDREKRVREKTKSSDEKKKQRMKNCFKNSQFFPLMCFIQTDKLLSRIVEMKQNAAINEHISIVIMKKTESRCLLNKNVNEIEYYSV